MSEKLVSENSFSIIGILKSVGIAYVVTLFIFLLLAIALTYTEFPETMIPSVVIIGTIISIMFAGTSVARKARTKGWLNGAIAGLVYILVIYLISSFTVVNFVVDMNAITMFILGILAGAVGGIVGINLKRR